MDIVAALRTLPATPLNPGPAILSVFEGDLTPQDSIPALPYAVVLRVSGRRLREMLAGGSIHTVMVDVYLEHRGTNGVRPHKRAIIALRNAVMNLMRDDPPDEYEPGWPLYACFKLQNTPDIMSVYQSNTDWFCTLRYQGQIMIKA